MQHGTARRLLLGAGWIRAAWMTVFFAAIGLGIVLVLRWWGNWQPIWDWQPIVLVSFLVAAPVGFLAGIGTLDYWTYYALGKPTRRWRPLISTLGRMLNRLDRFTQSDGGIQGDGRLHRNCPFSQRKQNRGAAGRKAE